MHRLEEKTQLSRTWLFLICVGFAVHGGTALLRLSTFFPTPKLVDFASFYAGSWAIRRGESPYAFSEDLVTYLRLNMGLSTPLPTLNSFPIWPWLLQPLTFLNYPMAATVWLALLLGVLVWSTLALARIAGVTGWLQRSLLGVLVITFGPIVLSLTLGQSSTLLLATVLFVCDSFEIKSPVIRLATLAAWIPAISTKLFPIGWLPIFLMRRQWQELILATMGVVLAVGLSFLLLPVVSRDYFLAFLPNQIGRFSADFGLDDQSLLAWLTRLGQSTTLQTPGWTVTETHLAQWTPPWDVAPELIQNLGYGFLVAIALAIAVRAGAVFVNKGRSALDLEIWFFLWVLFTLLPFPHTERYNHVLLLPALAWLWGQGALGRRYAVMGYFLTALSRLTHLWVLILPWPLAPVLTGSGVVAVLCLGVGVWQLLPTGFVKDSGNR